MKIEIEIDEWTRLTSQINRTIGFLLGMADGLERIAPDKAERCRLFAEALDAAKLGMAVMPTKTMRRY
jgi:hypothetical protein